MLKFITKTMCLTLVAVLCSWSLNAQELVSKKASDQAKYSYFAAPDRGIAANCNPVKNLKGVLAGKDVTLTWEAPEPPIGAGWLTYSGENEDAIGYISGLFDAWIAARWTAGDLTDLNGFKITKFKYYVYEELALASQSLKIWTGGSSTTPGTLVYSHDLTSADVPGAEQWIEIDVTPITINASKALWIGAAYQATQEGVHPAPIDGGPAKQGFGDLISQNGGTSFTSLKVASNGQIDGNWNLAIYVTDAKGNGRWLDNRANVTGYNVFRNGTKITTTSELRYIDTDLGVGEYRYCVSAAYDNGCESDQVCVPKIFIDECESPRNLALTETALQNKPAVKVEWEAPILVPETWVQRCGNPSSGIGGPSTMQLAVYFLPDFLAKYPQLHGMPITTFRFFPREQVNCTVKIWEGGSDTAPGTEVFSKTISKDEIDVQAWNEVRLDMPIYLDIEQPLWIGYTFTGGQSGTFPAGCDAGPMVPGGAKVFDGGIWKDLTQLNSQLNYNWCMSILVKGTNGRGIEIGGSRATVSNYLIYRNDELVKTNSASALSWIDTGGTTGLELGETYNYCVVAKYNNNCQSPIDALCEEITLEDTPPPPPAISEFANNVTIHPNPATNMVNITGTDIVKVEIYNMVGQMVDVKQGFVTTVDVSSYNNGLYLFKVYDVNNNSVTKRIMVSK